MAPPPRVHYLRENKMERTPRRLLVIDTETREDHIGDREYHRLRLWCARYLKRDGPPEQRPPPTELDGWTAGELVQRIDELVRKDATLWVLAHNLSFDLSTTRLPVLLLERGWSLTDHALHCEAPWARLVRGNYHLTLADIGSWLPKSAELLGKAVGIEKWGLPAQDAPDQVWLDYCRRDVELEAAAISELMDWWDREKLGNWSITGAATGFNAMRHMTPRRPIVIDPDPAARAFERTAVLAGRREVWRVGQLPPGSFLELDFENAHATIAAHLPLPEKRRRPVCGLDVDDWRITQNGGSVIAECVVRPAVPRYPLVVGRRVFHPTGEFRTVLCGPELSEARRRGELVSVGRGYEYRVGGHMVQWGQWLLRLLDGELEGTPEVARIAGKSWGRSVPGKWAGRTSTMYRERPSHIDGWAFEHGVRAADHAPLAIFHLAGRAQWWARNQEQDDSFPAVLAWIQSWTRVLLGRLVDQVGDARMIQCNTDSAWVEAGGVDELGLDAAAFWPLRARVKRTARRLLVLSPQHLVIDQEREMAGVPRSAVETEPLRYEWFSWPKLPRQLAIGGRGEYIRETRHASMAQVPVARWVWSDGRATAPTARLAAGGGSELVGDPLRLVAAGSVALRDAQHPALRGL